MAEDTFERSSQATAQRIKEEMGSPVSTREWSAYPHIFQLNGREPDFWKGKQILDVGSGNKWEEPEGAFPGARVYAIDPEFGGKIHSNTAHEKRRGIVQEIPYDDDRFDLVLSSHAVPQHVFAVDRPRGISEMIRVMKPAGEVRLAPCVRGHGDITSDIEMALEESGFEVEFIEGGTEGAITLIKANKRLREDKRLKREGWKRFHKTLFPEEEVRD